MKVPMTALDHHLKELNTALQKVLKWPYKTERVEIIQDLINYLHGVLNEAHNLDSDAP